MSAEITPAMRIAGANTLEHWTRSSSPEDLVSQVYVAMVMAAPYRLPHQDASTETVLLFEVIGKLDRIMAQLDDLTAVLTSIGDELSGLSGNVTTLVTDLETLEANTPPTVDLSGVIAQATALKTQLDGISTAAAAGVPAAPAGDATA